MKEGASQTGSKPEMGVLRKLVSGRLQAQAAGPHPDPDVLAAFAENALLQAERAQLLQHLGACDNCREILYLAAPDPAAAQQVLSYYPKRGSSLVFRWGSLVASVLIVGAAVIARYPIFHAHSKAPAAVTAPASKYPKVAEEKVPAEVEKMRDTVRAQLPSPSPSLVSKERPEAKHMTAKPQAGLEFDDSGQVRVSQGALAKLDKKSSNDELATAGGNALGLPDPANSQTLPASPGSAGAAANDKIDGRADYAYASRAAGERAAMANNHGTIKGTISDLSGAVVGSAKVTASGPVGTETAISDPEGRFAFNSLATGVYSVKAEANGFKVGEVKEIAVIDNKSSAIRVRLEPGKTGEAFVVSEPELVANELSDAVAATAPAEATHGSVTAEKQTSARIGLQKAVATNSPERANAPAPRWTISSDGDVQESRDQGKNWQNVKVADGAVFRALSVAGSHIWAGGSSGMLYHSVDSGQTWNQIQPAAANQKLTSDIVHIEFSDPANGLVSTSNGEIWSTSDGGQSWRRK